MSNKKKGRSIEKNRTLDEVEELLIAAQDDVLLNLNLNSHLTTHSSSSSSSLDLDLSRRFEALKSSKNTRVPLPPSKQPQQEEKMGAATNLTSDSTRITKVILPETQQKEKSKEEEELERVLGADLSARFATLKGSSSSSTSTTSTESHHVCPPVRSKDGDDNDDDDDADGDVEDEVDKVIQWAIDAARLDPSSPTEDGGDGEEDDDEDEDEDEEEEQEEEKEHNNKRSSQQQQKKK